MMKKYGILLLLALAVQGLLRAQESNWAYQINAGLNNPFIRHYRTVNIVQPRLSFALLKSTKVDWIQVLGRIDVQGIHEKSKRSPHPILGWGRQPGDIIKDQALSSALSIGSQLNIITWQKLSLGFLVNGGFHFMHYNVQKHEFENNDRNYVSKSPFSVLLRTGFGAQFQYKLSSSFSLGLLAEHGERFHLSQNFFFRRASGAWGNAWWSENIIMLSLRKHMKSN